MILKDYCQIYGPKRVKLVSIWKQHAGVWQWSQKISPSEYIFWLLCNDNSCHIVEIKYNLELTQIFQE